MDYFATFSPVVQAATIGMIISISLTHGWDIQQLDVNNVFQNGDLNETNM